MNNLIVHYVFRDIFLSGYIDFMVDTMIGYEHIFIVKRTARVFKHGIESQKATNIQINNRAHVELVDDDIEVFENKMLRNIIQQCDKLIISGVFDDLTYLLLYPDEIWSKTYLHFWGGDFYRFRDIDTNLDNCKLLHDFELLKQAVIRCKAVLTVVDADYERFVDILGIEKLHFEAPMPENSAFFDACISSNANTHSDGILNIVIGNSAASDNCHIEAFEKIHYLSCENIAIICPLSYGEVEYRRMVVDEGNRIFGDKIFFLYDFMPLDDYIAFLDKINVGIYNNNRQQGLKNIMIMLALGKKVYLRPNTAIWDKLKSLGITFFSIDDLSDKSSIFIPLSQEIRRSNYERINSFIHSYQSQWEYVLNDRSQQIFLKRCTQPISFNIHITDHCNLNCKGCSHFAPIASKWCISEEELDATLSHLKHLSSSIFKELCLMGGEPLLHPHIEKVLDKCRLHLPDIPIKIITNGLLITKQEETFWNVCIKNSIIIEVTYYPINLDYDWVVDYVKKKGVLSQVYIDRRDGIFRVDSLNQSGVSDIHLNYAKCRIGGVFPQIRNGKLYRCATAANIHIINEAFIMYCERYGLRIHELVGVILLYIPKSEALVEVAFQKILRPYYLLGKMWGLI